MYQSSLSLYMWHSSDVGLYGFSMALNIDCLHNPGTLFSVKHLLSSSGYYGMFQYY